MINRLLDEITGESLLTQDKISEHAVSFFQNVYSTARHSYTEMDTYLEDCSVKIPPTLSEDLDQPITIDEMETVIKSLKSNKSPGWDGLTAEFYQHFWDDIKQTLYQSYLESINHNSLSSSQRLGVINLIPKPKPPSELVYLKN